jgi:23S rRNA (cytosine1962-C5)-methyltransferase
VIPCALFEDEHLLVVNKPAGLNTHAPSPYASEGLYEWLRNREPRWAKLAIIHRLDKDTSGVMIFSKSALANRSLTAQFATRKIRKTYLLLTDYQPPAAQLRVKTNLIRVGEKYLSRPGASGGVEAETWFSPASVEDAKVLCTFPEIKVKIHAVHAEPLTGRTHQIRVHAAENGFPILGDPLYGATPASRLYLHAARITLEHPETLKEVTFEAPPDFGSDPRLSLRTGLIEPDLTDACRLVHGGSDGYPGWYVDKLGAYLLSQSEKPLTASQRTELDRLLNRSGARGAYHKILSKQVRGASVGAASPRHVAGDLAPGNFTIHENGLQFELSFREGYSVGLFLDQRDNRRRLLTGHVAAEFSLVPAAGVEKPELLNTFAYTCGFSVCAARAGLRTTSLDLSKKYLDWGKRNFELNQLAVAEHDFIFGDTFDWLGRFAKKKRQFDVIVIDPPTFSQSQESGAFRVEKDLGKLVEMALPILRSRGILFVSANAAGWSPEKFIQTVENAVNASTKKILQRHYVPQPPDFPGSRSEVPYLKTLWLRIS